MITIISMSTLKFTTNDYYIRESIITDSELLWYFCYIYSNIPSLMLPIFHSSHLIDGSQNNIFYFLG